MSEVQPNYRKKLIEVALPLEAINKASAREKSIRHGHPSTLHLWWARRPLAACRAVLFSSLVNDPDDDPMHGIDEDTAATERAKLFDLIEELVLWENSNNPDVINRARLEIARSIAANKVADGELEDDAQLVSTAPELPEEQAKYLPDPPPEYTPHDVRFKMPGLSAEQVNHFLAHYAPPVLDPFAGGGSIPLEAQRLGLRAYASDLNPVPVLINKALIEIPPRFAGQPPVNPEAQQGKLATKVYSRAEGLAEDVRYYGKWMRDEAEKRIGHLYPKVKVTQQMVDDGRPDLEPYVGQELTVIAWLWARTVKCPNPACRERTPLLPSFWLSLKKGQEAFTEPIVEGGSLSFKVRRDGEPPEPTSSRSGAACFFCKASITKQQLRALGCESGTTPVPIGICCDTNGGRIYVDPQGDNDFAEVAVDASFAQQAITDDKRWFSPPLYGLGEFADVFTRRQLAMLTQFADLISDVKEEIAKEDVTDDYAAAVVTYLALGVSKMTDYNSTLVTWIMQRNQAGHAFSKQAMPMIWYFAEVNPFVGAAGDLTISLRGIAKVIASANVSLAGSAEQIDAASALRMPDAMVSTDPPYYDNIGYADLSDFFYVWLRRCLAPTYPKLLATVLTPKANELIAASHRHDGNKEKARNFFEEGLGTVFSHINREAVDNVPATIYYAFKQSEKSRNGDGVASTGWETMLSGLILNGFTISGTWPMRTERETRSVGMGTNALASSIILVCRKRDSDASMVTRRDFANALRKELPEAIKHLQSGNVAPVDLAQASIGPGMAVFSRYSKVVNADGSPMSVREALQLINQVLDESLVEQESDFDAETRFALRWFEQYGMTEGPFGDAETLAKAMAVSVNGIVDADIGKSGAGKVQLLSREELDPDWDPVTDSRLTMWEVSQHLIRTLESGGESAAADLLQRVGTGVGEIARELAYRLYQTCERKKLAEEARSYNGLVISWPEIRKLSRQAKPKKQTELFE